ncbi:MAG: OmpA family protein [Sulfurimonas sp.]|nr:OmpA family protein [Sulfurimonas sp.]
MKKLLLISALLGSMAIAQDYKYEITPIVGYNIVEGNLDLDNQFLIGAAFQYNDFDTLLKPELSILYTDADYENFNISTDILRIAVSGVHEYDSIGSLTPLTKIGVGYETIDRHLAENKDSIFFNAGAGVKIAFTDNIALKLEAVYMLKNNDNRWDNNLALLAGINFAFGPKAQIQAEPEPEPTPIPVDGDDDKDGVLNSVDQCPNTPAGKKVNYQGCFIDGDDDKDGVLNSVDQCPNTPAGNVVNNDGCTKIVNLNVNFENNSYIVDEISKQKVKKFADFLKVRSNFTAQIIGHTNNIGRESDNQILSENRANAVKDLIIEYGVEQHRISASGKGENNPTASNNTAEGLAQNRRIEATLNKN